MNLSANKQIDSVCRMQVTSSSLYKTHYENQELYFCSEHCQEKFSLNPQKYLSKKSLENTIALTKVAATKQQYGCPMYPQITQIKLGDCPICGMSLEPIGVLVSSLEDESLELKTMQLRF